jgi:hypothetical protein
LVKTTKRKGIGAARRGGYLIYDDGGTYIGQGPRGERIDSGESELKDVWASVIAYASAASKSVTLDGAEVLTSAKLALLTNKANTILGSTFYGTKIKGNNFPVGDPMIVANDGEVALQSTSYVRMENIWGNPNRDDFAGKVFDMQHIGRGHFVGCNAYNDAINPASEVPAAGSRGWVFKTGSNNMIHMINCHVHRFEYNIDFNDVDWVHIEGMYNANCKSRGISIGSGAGLRHIWRGVHFYRVGGSPFYINTTTAGRQAGRYISIEDATLEGDAVTAYGAIGYDAGTEMIFHNNVIGGIVKARNCIITDLTNSPTPLLGIRGGPGALNVELLEDVPVGMACFARPMTAYLSYSQGAKQIYGWTTSTDHAVPVAIANGTYAKLTTSGANNDEKFIVIPDVCRRDQAPIVVIQAKNLATADYRTFIGTRAKGTVTDSQLVSNDDIRTAVGTAQYYGVQHSSVTGQTRIVGANSAHATENISRLDEAVANFAKIALIFGSGGTTRARCKILDSNGGQIFHQTASIGIPDDADVLDLVIGIKALAAAVKELEIHTAVLN